MFKSILIPVALDHDVDIASIIATARRLLADGGKITLVAVIEDIPDYGAEYAAVKPAEHLHQDIKQRLADLAKGQKNLEEISSKLEFQIAIPDLASETSADLIVINSHKPGVEDYFLGSTTSRVVRRSHCAVLVLR